MKTRKRSTFASSRTMSQGKVPSSSYFARTGLTFSSAMVCASSWMVRCSSLNRWCILVLSPARVAVRPGARVVVGALYTVPPPVVSRAAGSRGEGLGGALALELAPARAASHDGAVHGAQRHGVHDLPVHEALPEQPQQVAPAPAVEPVGDRGP